MRTQYQIVAKHEDGRLFEVGFSRIKSRDGIVRCVQRRAEHFLSVSGVSRNSRFFNRPGSIWVDGWNVSFSGHTLRDVMHTAKVTP